MLSYLIYTNEDFEELRGRIELPSRKIAYTNAEIHEKFLARVKENYGKTLLVWVKNNNGEEIAVKVESHQSIETILKYCCNKFRLDKVNYQLKIGSTLLPQNKQIGMFADNGDEIMLVRFQISNAWGVTSQIICGVKSEKYAKFIAKFIVHDVCSLNRLMDFLSHIVREIKI